MTRIWLENHPMKREVIKILSNHFAPSIVKNFMFMFEAELYDTPNTLKQVKDDMLIMEVKYRTSKETSEYICDIYSWMTKEQVQYKLLMYITDAYKSGKIGKDWVEINGKLMSKDISSGKYETKEVNLN